MQDFFVCNRAWVESEQSSHRISCILQEFGEIFGLDTKFAQFDRMYFTFFLQCNQCINEIGRTVALFWLSFQPFSCNVLYSHAGKLSKVCLRQGNESCSMRKLWIISTHGMF